MKDAKRVDYDIEVMARLRYPMRAADHVDPPEAADLAREAIWVDRERYAKDLVHDHEDRVEHEYLIAEALDDDPGPPPNVIMSELSNVSGQITDLEDYRERLLVFARTLASKPLSARKLAESTGLSHSTIVRMATAEAIAEIAAEAGAVAAGVLQDLDPQDDPQLYLRLQGASRMVTKQDDQ
jgi:hypothetical protein